MNEENVQLKSDSLRKAWEDGCSDVKKVLENLYPEFEFAPELVFEFPLSVSGSKSGVKSVDLPPIIDFIREASKKITGASSKAFQIRSDGEYYRKGIYLAGASDKNKIKWSVVIDEFGYQVLIFEKVE